LAYQRDASGNVLRGPTGTPLLIVPTTAGLPYSQLTLLERGMKAKKEYLRYFPSLNASYNFSDGLIGRLAYSQSVGRPDFNQYAGGVTLPDIELLNPNSRITVNNASIRAWQAETYMARLEYYFGTVGSLSFGTFIRDYENFFVTVTDYVSPSFLETYGLDAEEYGSILTVTQFNNPARVRQHGFEIDYKQSLTFLPQWARGFQFFANISSQRARGTDNLPDMNPFTANWGLSFTRPKFNLRINENYRGIQRRAVVASTATNSIEPGTYNYIPKRLYIDITGEYYFRRSLAFFFALRNVGGATEDTKIYGPNTPLYARFRQRDDYASLWTAGVKGSF
jgi:outer membrane receptor protein involved in Fe transport